MLDNAQFVDDGQPGREARGRQIAKLLPIKQVGSLYAVPSQTQPSQGYLVDLVEQTCTCPDHELRGRNLRCKHQEAVLYFVAWGSEVSTDGSVTETLTIKRKTYKRDWSKYNAGAVSEKPYFDRLLKALCDGIAEPPRTPGRGRPRRPLRDQTFAALAKVYMGGSGRWTTGVLDDEYADKGLIGSVGHFNSIYNFLAAEGTTALLTSLIEETAKPLAAIENGQYAIDSTGFSTVTYDRWFDQKHGKLRAEHPWIKLHLACGTVTHAITAVKVSPEGDCPTLPELLAQTMKNCMVRELSADKAYASVENHETTERFGVEAFIPFHVNAVINPKSREWSEALCKFLFQQERFLKHYHRRSNCETVMMMLKQRFGGAVASKKPLAQVNEVLAKCVCHNLAALTHAIFTAGLAPEFWKDAPAVPAAPTVALVPPVEAVEALPVAATALTLVKS